MLKNAASRDAQLKRSGGDPGFPKPPLSAAPSARAGHGGKVAYPIVDTEPIEPVGSGESTAKSERAGRYSFYSTRPQAQEPEPIPARAKEVVEMSSVPAPAFADKGHGPTGAARVSAPPRKVTLVQGSLAAPVPTAAPTPAGTNAIRPSGAPTMGASIPARPIRWHADGAGPSVRSRPVAPALEKANSISLLVLLALSLTLLLVVTALVVNALSR